MSHTRGSVISFGKRQSDCTVVSVVVSARPSPSVGTFSIIVAQITPEMPSVMRPRFFSSSARGWM